MKSLADLEVTSKAVERIPESIGENIPAANLAPINPHPQPDRSPRNPPSPLERVPVREDAQSWYFRGAPLALDVFPGMSGAEATGGQEKYRGNQPRARGVVLAA